MNSFINQIADSIYNYSQQQNMNGITIEYCTALAWGTMIETDLFQEMLTPSEQALANNIFLTEQNNIEYDSSIPIQGTHCE
jgi:hypothetical protein